MDARENLHAAFDGRARDCPAVLCYPTILVRDHWDALTDLPWWTYYHSTAEQLVKRWRDCLAATGIQWAPLPRAAAGDAERAQLEFLHDGGTHFLLNRATGEKKALSPPGDHLGTILGERSTVIRELDDIEIHVPSDHREQLESAFDDGRFRDALFVRAQMQDVFLYAQDSSVFYKASLYFTFEDFLTSFYDKPDLMHALLERLAQGQKERMKLFGRLGADAVWIEDLFGDMVSPEIYREFAAAYLEGTIETIRAAGMKSILYYCGNPKGRLETLLELRPDALAFEESKKGFTIDIGELAERIRGRVCLFGNLDSIGVLQNGDETALRAALEGQLAAARINDGRFVFCTGSPITPSTPVETVRRFFEYARSAWDASRS